MSRSQACDSLSEFYGDGQEKDYIWALYVTHVNMKRRLDASKRVLYWKSQLDASKIQFYRVQPRKREEMHLDAKTK